MPRISRFTFAIPVLITSIFIASALSQASDRSEKISIRVSEGTAAAFDGSLWTVPGVGGNARPVADAELDLAADRDRTLAPDGRRVVFRAERNGRTGLWLLNLGERAPRQLPHLSDPRRYHGHAAWSRDG